MKNINYKELRKYSNLPKYDIGTRPISSGYLLNTDPVQVGYYTLNATPITLNFVPQAISSSAADLTSVGSMVAKTWGNESWLNAFPSLFKDLILKESATKWSVPATSGGTAAGTAGAEVGAETGTSAGSSAAGAASTAMGALAAIHGGIQFVGNQLDYSNTLSAGDLQNYSAKSTEYINGVAYDRYGGYDAAGADKYVKALNNAAMLKGITSGAETGAGVGTMVVPGLGTGIGAGIGALVGFVGGLLGRSHRKKKYAEAKRNWATAATNYNLQSESEAASQGLRNQYYATHADEGLSVDTKNPNALVQGGEPILKYKNGKLVGADMFPITPLTPERVDNIPVRLDKGSTKDGVIGNLRDPETGERLAVEARPWVLAYNSPDPELQALGEANLNQIMAKQEQLLNMKKMKRYHMGKCLPMFDKGTDYYSIIPALIGSGAGLALYLSYKGDKPTVRDSYSPNTQAAQALSMLSRRKYDPYPVLQDINDAVRQGMYNINQSPYSGGQRMAMLSSLYNNRMKNLANVYAQADEINNKYLADYAQAMMTHGEAEAQRRQQARAQYNQDYDRAVATRRKGMETGIAGFLNSLFKGDENMRNDYWTKKNIDLWREDLESKRK